MIYLYLDESGCLGFNFKKKNTSNFFTITILAASSDNQKISYAIKKTLKRKINHKKSKRLENELKATQTTLSIKQYFYKQLENAKFNIYTITLNKKRVNSDLKEHKNRIYNYITRLIIDKIPLQKITTRAIFILDKCKGKPEIKNFNNYIIEQIKGRLNPKIPFDIRHLESHNVPGLQAVDLFCWGIYRKYENKDYRWYNEFKDRIRFETKYL